MRDEDQSQTDRQMDTQNTSIDRETKTNREKKTKTDSES